jgi:hypothetical protein
MALFQIINGDHRPPHPFVVFERLGMHVDLSDVAGQLYDAPTVAKVEWGLLDEKGKLFGRVVMKSGKVRIFRDGDLVKPYLAAYLARKAELGV